MRKTSFGFAAMILIGCSGVDNEPGTSGAGGHTPGSGGTTTITSVSAGSGGANSGSTGTSGTGTAGSVGTSGTGTSGTGTGTGGTSGTGTGSTGTGGTSGTGTSASGTGGASGTGTGGSVGGGGTRDGGADATTPVDSGGATDARRDVVPVPADSSTKSRMTARPIGMPYAKNGFWEYLPPNYGDGVKRPLLLFMHGSGENGAGTVGTELNKVLKHGPAKLINTNVWTADRPFVVLSMQHAGGATCPTAGEVHDFLTFAISSYDVDPTRVYITGLSCGGHGGFAYLGQYKGEQVAAAVLIAADCSPAYNSAGCSLLNTVGLWTIHGENDGPAQDQAGMAKFLACPQPRKDARWNLIPGANHQQTWEAVYDDTTFMNNVVDWFLGQSK